METTNKKFMSMETAGVLSALGNLYNELINNGYYKGLYEYSIEDFKKLKVKSKPSEREDGLFYQLFLYDGIEYRNAFFTAGELACFIENGIDPSQVDEYNEFIQKVKKDGGYYLIRAERKE